MFPFRKKKKEGLIQNRPLTDLEKAIKCGDVKEFFTQSYRTPYRDGTDSIEFIRAQYAGNFHNKPHFRVLNVRLLPVNSAPENGKEYEKIDDRLAIVTPLYGGSCDYLFRALLYMAAYEATQMPLFQSAGLTAVKSDRDSQHFKIVANQARVLFDLQDMPVAVSQEMLADDKHEINVELTPHDRALLDQWRGEHKTKEDSAAKEKDNRQIFDKKLKEVLYAIDLPKKFREAASPTDIAAEAIFATQCLLEASQSLGMFLSSGGTYVRSEGLPRMTETLSLLDAHISDGAVDPAVLGFLKSLRLSYRLVFVKELARGCHDKPDLFWSHYRKLCQEISGIKDLSYIPLLALNSMSERESAELMFGFKNHLDSLHKDYSGWIEERQKDIVNKVGEQFRPPAP